MRTTQTALLTATALSALACTATIKEPNLQRDGSLDHETDGAVLYEDREGGFAGMWGTTCEFSQRGTPGTDVNVDGHERPQVLDGHKEGDDTVVLARTRDTLHLIAGGDWSMDVTASVDVAGVEHAFLTHDGIIAAGACSLRWLSDSEALRHTVNLEGEGCEQATLAVDKHTSTAFVTAGGQVMRVDRNGHEALGHTADQILFSQALDGLLLAEDRSGELRFITASGELLWTMNLDPHGRYAAVDSMADMGGDGMLAVTTAGPEPTLFLLDGATGEIVLDTAMNEHAEVIGSPDGKSLGLVLPSRVELFTVR